MINFISSYLWVPRSWNRRPIRGILRASWGCRLRPSWRWARREWATILWSRGSSRPWSKLNWPAIMSCLHILSCQQVGFEKSLDVTNPGVDPTKLFFLLFIFFVIKLGHFTINNFALYVMKTQAYQQKAEKFFVSKEKSFVGSAPESL